MSGESFMLRAREDGTFEKYEPFATVCIDTEEDLKKIEKALEMYTAIPSLLDDISKVDNAVAIKMMKDFLESYSETK